MNTNWNRDFKNAIPQNDGLSSSDGSFSSATATNKDNEKQSTVFEKFISLSMAAIFFGLPIFFTGVTFQGVSFEKQIYFYVWLLIGVIAWTSKGMITGKMSIKRTPLDFMILFFVATYLLSAIFSIDKWHSFWGFFGDPSRGFANILALLIAYYFISSNFSLKRLKLSLSALAISGALVSIWSLLILLKIQILPQALAKYAPFSAMGSVVGLTVFIAFMVPILLTLFAKIGESSKKTLGGAIWKSLLALNVFLNLLILLMLYSYASWLAIIVGISIYLIFILSRIVILPKRSNWLAMSVFAGVMMIMMIGQEKIARVNLPVEATPAPSLSWDIAKKALGENLVLGSGNGTYGYAFSKFKPQQFNDNQLSGVRFYQGTGLFFESLPTIGILGSFSLLLLVLSFVSVSLYLLSKGKAENRTYSLGLVSASMILLLSSMLNVVDGGILILGSLVCTLALAVILRESEVEEKHLELDLKASPKYALALAFVFMVVSAGVAFVFIFIGKVFVADVYAGLAVKNGTVTEDGSIWKLKKAVGLNPQEGRYFTRIGQEYMVLANTETLKADNEGDLGLRNSYSRLAIQFAGEGKNRMVNDALASEVLARVLENAVSIDSSLLDPTQDAYRAALDLDPKNQDLILKLAQVKMAKAEKSEVQKEKDDLTKEAKELLLQSIELKKGFAPGYYNLALLLHKSNEVDEAIVNMAQAVNADKNNESYKISLSRMLVLRNKDKDLESAENVLKGILRNNNQQAIAHLDLGLLYERTNRLNEAKGEYERALELVSADAEEERNGIRKMIEGVGRNIVTDTPAPAVQVVEPAPPAQIEPSL